MCIHPFYDESDIPVQPGTPPFPRPVNTMSNQLTLEILLSLSPFKTDKDMVMKAARDVLLNCLQMEPHVHDVFFPDTKAHTLSNGFKCGNFPMFEFATAFVASAIAQQRDEDKFYAMIDRNAVEETLSNIYDSVQWKKIGFLLYTWVYPDVVQDAKTGVTLREYLDRGHIWADKLVEEIMKPKWTMRYVERVARGWCSEDEYNRDMNALFVKLHLLDPQSVIPVYQYLLNQRALPTVNLELATRNYLGGRLDTSKIADYVRVAIKKPHRLLNIPRLCCASVDVFSGIEVEQFIMIEGRKLGMWSGQLPDNHKISRFRDRCCIM